MPTRGDEPRIRALIEGEDPPGDGAAVELDLFGELPSPVILQAEAKGLSPRAGGRPQGAKGRAQLDLVRFIRATRRPALLALQDVVDLTWGELARMLSCSPYEAAEFWRRCVAALLPYVERKQPQAVELTPGAGIVPVVIFGTEPVRPDLADGNPPIEGEWQAREATSARQEAHDQLEPEEIQWVEPPIREVPEHTSPDPDALGDPLGDD